MCLLRKEERDLVHCPSPNACRLEASYLPIGSGRAAVTEER